MKIFTIIVTYNGMQWYNRCLGSLRDSEIPVETIVIDNASTDETVSYIKEHFPEVCLIESKENLGFAKANNIGMKRALDSGADYVFLLNQDAWVEKDTLSKLVQTFVENENVGIASPIHLNGEYTGMDWAFAKCVPDGFISDSYMQKLEPYYPVRFVNAAVWLINAECIRKVGGFDILLFVHYGEDDNYCQRVLYHGYKIIINTTCTACHDREYRVAYEEQYRQKNFSDSYRMLKIELGNINEDRDLSSLVREEKKCIVKSIMKFSFRQMKEHFRRISIIRQINESRQKNIAGNGVWLND